MISDAILTVRLLPRSSTNKIVGRLPNGDLKIKLIAPPVDNKANMALIKFLAKTLDIRKTDIDIIKGQTSKQKTILIKGLTPNELEQQLNTFISN